MGEPYGRVGAPHAQPPQGARRLSILVLSDVPPGALGGAEVQALQLARRWAADGHRVVVAGYANRPSREPGLEIVRIPTLRATRALRGATYLLSTLRLIFRRRREFDVIYCRFLKEQALVAAIAKILFRLRQPLVACPESSSIHGDVHALARSLLRPLSTRLLDAALTAVNAISGRIERELSTLALAAPTVRIPNGVVMPPSARPRAVSGERLRVLFVGRLVEVKGLDVLIGAVAMLRGRADEFQVRLVGDGPLRGELEAEVRVQRLEGCVEFAGAVPPERVAQAYRDADLFVLPSRYEGLPVALLEASAHGLAAVVTRVSGSEDVVDEATGWIVPPDDPAALAAALEAALGVGRDALHAMGARAREKIARDYDLDKVSRAYLRLFDDLVAGRGAAGDASQGGLLQSSSDR